MSKQLLDIPETAPSRPEANVAWYTQPMVLLVVAIPLTAVLVSFTLLAISIISFDGVVIDDYYKYGKEINQVLNRDNTAREMGIEAEIRINQQRVLVKLHAKMQLNLPDKLPLHILHPTQAGKDIKIDMQRVDVRTYTANPPNILKGDWIIQIVTEQWRLSGRLTMAENTVAVLSSEGIRPTLN